MFCLPILVSASVPVQYNLKDTTSDPVDVQITAGGAEMDFDSVYIKNSKTVIVDVDQDGSPELQTVGGRAELEKFNAGSGGAAPATINTSHSNIKNLQTADLDGDGLEDVVVGEASRQTPKRDFGDRLKVEVRGWDPDRKEAIEAKVKLVTEKDENIAKAEVEEDKIEISYRRPAKLLGFIPVAYYHAFMMDGKGNISSGTPWWLAFAKSDADAFSEDVKYVFQNNQTNLEFLRLQDAVARQSRAFEVLSNILKTRHDVAMNAIRNMK
ncbi:MAG: hypothetical protein G01um101419_304 [Parcubacteria group bacterium Gr01-1014_19]|nr:MAG: hypothetical protein G01um101419_304 [Parcubacteria group bacterium Gr01-1014_19]